MIKKTFSLLACALFAFAAYGYTNEGTETNESNEQGLEQALFAEDGTDTVNDQGSEEALAQDDSEETLEPQSLAQLTKEEETTEDADLAQLTEDEESTQDADLAHDETSEEGISEETTIAACGNGKCPALMLEKLRSEQQEQETTEEQNA